MAGSGGGSFVPLSPAAAFSAAALAAGEGPGNGGGADGFDLASGAEARYMPLLDLNILAHFQGGAGPHHNGRVAPAVR